MRCHICNAPLQSIKFDPRDHSIKPCGTCEEVIQHAVGELDHKTIQTDLDYAYETGYTLFEEDVE